MLYEIQGRSTDYTSGWHADALGTNDTTFESREDAQEAIDGLAELLGWDRDDMRIVEVESELVVILDNEGEVHEIEAKID